MGTKTIFLDFPKNTIIYVGFVNYFVYLTLGKNAKIIYTILMKKCKFGLHSDTCVVPVLALSNIYQLFTPWCAATLSTVSPLNVYP